MTPPPTPCITSRFVARITLREPMRALAQITCALERMAQQFVCLGDGSVINAARGGEARFTHDARGLVIEVRHRGDAAAIMAETEAIWAQSSGRTEARLDWRPHHSSRFSSSTSGRSFS